MTRLPETAWRGAWVIARRIYDGSDGEGNALWHWEYWGGDRGNGSPRRSLWLQDGFHFTSARSALECTETHRDLRGSDEWRVIPARPREASIKTTSPARATFCGAVIAKVNGGQR